jgi:hypothetical protein
MSDDGVSDDAQQDKREQGAVPPIGGRFQKEREDNIGSCDECARQYECENYITNLDCFKSV